MAKRKILQLYDSFCSCSEYRMIAISSKILDVAKNFGYEVHKKVRNTSVDSNVICESNHSGDNPNFKETSYLEESVVHIDNHEHKNELDPFVNIINDGKVHKVKHDNVLAKTQSERTKLCVVFVQCYHISLREDRSCQGSI